MMFIIDFVLVFLTFTSNRGLELLLHAGASWTAITTECLHPKQVDGARRQVGDLDKILLKDVHDVGGYIQVVILTRQGEDDVKQVFVSMMGGLAARIWVQRTNLDISFHAFQGN